MSWATDAEGAVTRWKRCDLKKAYPDPVASKNHKSMAVSQSSADDKSKHLPPESPRGMNPKILAVAQSSANDKSKHLPPQSPRGMNHKILAVAQSSVDDISNRLPPRSPRSALTSADKMSKRPARQNSTRCANLQRSLPLK